MARRPVLRQSDDGATVEVVVPSRDPTRPSDRLRYEAMAVYVFNPDGITVEELHEDPRFSIVATNTLREWCKNDGWVEARKEALKGFSDKLIARLQKQLYSRVAQVRIKQMERTGQLLEDLTAKALAAEVKSAEGAAKVVGDLMKHELGLANEIAQEILPAGGGVGGSSIAPRNGLTDEEVVDAARIVLASRRKAVLHAPTQEPQQLVPGEAEGVGSGGA